MSYKVLHTDSYYKTSQTITTEDDYDYSNWFLPSQDELQAMYDNLKSEGVGGFETATYLSSSENDSTTINVISFDSGNSSTSPKYIEDNVRPCRTFRGGNYSLRDEGPGGGLVFYIDGDLRYEAYPNDISDSYVWSNITDVAIGTTGTAIGTGITNTNAIINQTGHNYSAAQICLNIGGLSLISCNYTIGDNKDLPINLPVGKTVTFYWGDGQKTVHEGAGEYTKVTAPYTESGDYDITLSGDIYDITEITIFGAGFYGDVSVFAGWTQLTYLSLLQSNMTGDASALKTLTMADLINIYDADISFDSSDAWTGVNCYIEMHCSWTSTEVDNALIAFSGGDFSGQTISIGDNNAARTSASDSAYNTLIANGNTVTVNT